jgi:hypothetical protein
MKKKYPRKWINFNEENESDMKLYEELKRLPHGKFTEETKEYWRTKLGLKENV